MDLQFELEGRDILNNGEPMTPYIVVRFMPCREFELSFKCFRAAVMEVERSMQTKNFAWQAVIRK
jgi:hypothetical protein